MTVTDVPHGGGSLSAPEDQVMTVTGPMPASALGVTNAHDHLFLRSPVLAGQEVEDLQRQVQFRTAGTTPPRPAGSGVSGYITTAISLDRRASR